MSRQVLNHPSTVKDGYGPWKLPPSLSLPSLPYSSVDVEQVVSACAAVAGRNSVAVYSSARDELLQLIYGYVCWNELRVVHTTSPVPEFPLFYFFFFSIFVPVTVFRFGLSWCWQLKDSCWQQHSSTCGNFTLAYLFTVVYVGDIKKRLTESWVFTWNHNVFIRNLIQNICRQNLSTVVVCIYEVVGRKSPIII